MKASPSRHEEEVDTVNVVIIRIDDVVATLGSRERTLSSGRRSSCRSCSTLFGRL